MSDSTLTTALQWLYQTPIEILFLAVLPFVIAALALLADRAHQPGRDRP